MGGVQTLSVIVPFFALVLIGYIATRAKLIPVVAVGGLNAFVLYFALPAALFQSAANTPTADLLNPGAAALWTVVGLGLMSIAVTTGRRDGRSWLDASFGGLVAVNGNTVFMGYPIVLALLGPKAAGVIVIVLLIDVVVLQSVTIAMSQRDQHGSMNMNLRVAARRVLQNPMPWAIMLGAIWGVMSGRIGVTTPGPVNAVLDMLGGSATPVALFTIGAVLARESLRPKLVGEPATATVKSDVWWLTMLKLLAHPIIVWVLGMVAIRAGFPLDTADLTALTLLAALPSAANVSMLAERLGADNGRVAKVIMLSTTVGFVTFTGVAVLLQP